MIAVAVVCCVNLLCLCNLYKVRCVAPVKKKLFATARQPLLQSLA